MIAPLQSSTIALHGMSRSMMLSIAKALIVMGALVTSIFVDSLGLVNVINGALSAGIFVALIPSVLGMFMLEPGPFKKLSLFMLLVLGLALAGMGIVFSKNYVGDLSCKLTVNGHRLQ